MYHASVADYERSALTVLAIPLLITSSIFFLLLKSVLGSVSKTWWFIPITCVVIDLEVKD